VKNPSIKILQNAITEEFNHFLIEVLDKPKETQYKEIKKSYQDTPLTVYRFKTDSGTSYDLEFYENNFEEGDVMLTNNVKIYHGVDIAFSMTNKTRKNDDEYHRRTALNEQYELFSRISFLIKKYIENNSDVDCYIIGFGEYASNMRIYKKLYENIFSLNFDIIEGTNPYYTSNKAYYFVKKDIINKK
jgi:hypothetical protein